MNNIYVHNKKNNLNLLYIISFILLIFYGFYKNGILLREFGIISMIKPLIIPSVTIIINLLFSKIKKIKFLNNNLIYLLLISLMVPSNMSIILFSIIILIVSILLYFVIDKINLKFNVVAVIKLLIMLLLFVLGKNSYLNSIEQAHVYSYDLLDVFLGRGISGICSSSILLILIGYLILYTNEYYKKEIPIISLCVYLLGTVVMKLVFHKVFIINALIIYSMVFIAPINEYSPVGKNKKIIYSILIGILTLLFTYFITAYDGVILAILISSLINYIDLKFLSNDI